MDWRPSNLSPRSGGSKSKRFDAVRRSVPRAKTERSTAGADAVTKPLQQSGFSARHGMSIKDGLRITRRQAGRAGVQRVVATLRIFLNSTSCPKVIKNESAITITRFSDSVSEDAIAIKMVAIQTSHRYRIVSYRITCPPARAVLLARLRSSFPSPSSDCRLQEPSGDFSTKT